MSARTDEAMPHVLGALACAVARDSIGASEHLITFDTPAKLYPALIAWVEGARVIADLDCDDTGFWYIEGVNRHGEHVSIDESLPDARRWAVQFFTAQLNRDTDATVAMFKATLEGLQDNPDLLMSRVSTLLSMCADIVREASS